MLPVENFTTKVHLKLLKNLTFTIQKSSFFKISNYLANIYLFKFSYRNTRKRCEICLKLTIKTLKRRHRRRFGVFIVNF